MRTRRVGVLPPSQGTDDIVILHHVHDGNAPLGAVESTKKSVKGRVAKKKREPSDDGDDDGHGGVDVDGDGAKWSTVSMLRRLMTSRGAWMWSVAWQSLAKAAERVGIDHAHVRQLHECIAPLVHFHPGGDRVDASRIAESETTCVQHTSLHPLIGCALSYVSTQSHFFCDQATLQVQVGRRKRRVDATHRVALRHWMRECVALLTGGRLGMLSAKERLGSIHAQSVEAAVELIRRTGTLRERHGEMRELWDVVLNRDDEGGVSVVERATTSVIGKAVSVDSKVPHFHVKSAAHHANIEEFLLQVSLGVGKTLSPHIVTINGSLLKGGRADVATYLVSELGRTLRDVMRIVWELVTPLASAAEVKLEHLVVVLSRRTWYDAERERGGDGATGDDGTDVSAFGVDALAARDAYADVIDTMNHEQLTEGKSGRAGRSVHGTGAEKHCMASCHQYMSQFKDIDERVSRMRSLEDLSVMLNGVHGMLDVAALYCGVFADELAGDTVPADSRVCCLEAMLQFMTICVDCSVRPFALCNWVASLKGLGMDGNGYGAMESGQDGDGEDGCNKYKEVVGKLSSGVYGPAHVPPVVVVVPSLDRAPDGTTAELASVLLYVVPDAFRLSFASHVHLRDIMSCSVWVEKWVSCEWCYDCWLLCVHIV